MAFSPGQRRDLVLLTALSSFSLVGDTIALITLYLRVAAHGGGWLIAELSIAGALPLVLLAGPAGYVVDHVNAKRFLAWCCLGEALVCVAIGYWHGDAATISLMALLTCGVAFTKPGYGALVPSLCGEENVLVAQSTLQSGQSFALVGGPALGGILVGWIGQSGPLYIDAATFFVAAVATLGLRGDRHAAAPREHEAHQLSAGLRFLMSHPTLRPVVVTAAVFMLSLGAVNVAEVFFVTRTLHAGALAYGLVGASFGVGAVLGSLSARWVGQVSRTLVYASLALIGAIGVLIGAVGLVERIAYVYPLMVVTGVAVGLVNVTIGTLFLIESPEALRGRVGAAANATLTSAEITSMVVGGLLLSVIAPRTVFQLAGVVAAVTVIAVAPLELRASRKAHGVLPAQGD